MTPPELLVAVDISHGEVVRLRRGDLSLRTVYGSDPVATALGWEEQGAGWLHVVDLDAAMTESGENREAIVALLEKVSIPVQVGGGLRTLDAMGEWLNLGAARVVIGTRAVESGFLTEAVRRFGDRVVAALDARADPGRPRPGRPGPPDPEGVRGVRVRTEGWKTRSSLLEDAMSQVVAAGASQVMFTDIERDGMLSGPNLATVERVCAFGVPVIASGGISSTEDLRSLAHLGPKGVSGVIVGRALYEGAFTVAQAHEALERAC